MAGAKPKAKGVSSGRKLPRTPDEYADLNRKICAATSSQCANNDTASGITNLLELPCTLPKVGLSPLDNVSESSSTLSETSQYDKGTSGFHPYIVVLSDNDTVDNAKQETRSDDNEVKKLKPETIDRYRGSGTAGYEKLNKATMESQICSAHESKSITMHFDEGTSQNACPEIIPDEKTSGYEKLNPETMDSYPGSATTGYEKLNKATMEPQTCSVDLDGTGMAMHLEEQSSQSVYLEIISDDKKGPFERLDPEMMDQGFGTTDYEKLNKATMEPQTCSADLDGTGMAMHLDEQTSQSVYLEIISEDKKDHFERLDPEIMDQGSGTTDYEKLDKTTMETQTCSADFDDASITMHLDERSVFSTPRSDDKTNDYEKLNPETMDSYHKSDRTDYEKLNRATMEPQDSPDDPDGNDKWIYLGIF